MLKSSRPGLRRFARNTRGNIAVLFGLAVIPIVLGIGVAIDYGRALIVRERMSSAADAAALAIGSWAGLTDAERKAKAQQYFDANYPSAALGATGALNVTFPGDDIKVDVSATVPTTFMRLANIDSINVGSSALITVKHRKIELALVLDTTGSMSSSGKMTSLKNAADDMVDTLFGSSAVSTDVKIAVVPFSGAVNIGTDKLNSGWLDKATHPNTSKIAKEDHKFSNGQSILKLFDDLHRADLGRARDRPARQHRTQQVRQAAAGVQLPGDCGDAVLHGRVVLDVSCRFDVDRAVAAHAPKVVAQQVHDHRQLRAVLGGVGEFVRVGLGGARALDRAGGHRAVGVE